MATRPSSALAGAAERLGRALTDAVLRDIWFGRVWRANACRVVEDTPGGIVVYLPPGSPARYPVDPEGREVRIPARSGWKLGVRTVGQDALALFRAGERHSVWLFWHADGSFAHWYVNFEERLGRTRLGLDYRDEKLDLVVAADGTLRWKDEEELQEAARRGLVDEAVVRAEATRVLSHPPWPTGWENWRPDPAWPLPELPDGWDVV